MGHGIRMVITPIRVAAVSQNNTRGCGPGDSETLVHRWWARGGCSPCGTHTAVPLTMKPRMTSAQQFSFRLYTQKN